MQLDIDDKLLVTLPEHIYKIASIFCSPQQFLEILFHDNSFDLIFSLHNPVSHLRANSSKSVEHYLRPNTSLHFPSSGKQYYLEICSKGANLSSSCWVSFLEIFKIHLEMALGSLLWVSLLGQWLEQRMPSDSIQPEPCCDCVIQVPGLPDTDKD